MTLLVGPSQQRRRWHEFFTSLEWDPEEFRALIDSDPPGAAFFEIETYVNGLYRALQRDQELRLRIGLDSDPDQLAGARFKARWIVANSSEQRAALGSLQRELDLGLMQWMRRASCLSTVIGAGVSMDAGAPSWPALVRRLLSIAIERGHEIAEMREEPRAATNVRQFRALVTEVKRLPSEREARARTIVSAIDGTSADTEMLMEGAELCLELMGQHLFTDITSELYKDGRQPGSIHRAIAAIAVPQLIHDRGGWFPGWDAIITYNFDDLMGEALDAAEIARAAYAMRGEEMAGDPNEKARAAGANSLHQPIYHLHGYTPRKLFLITKVKFVFSTSQYLDFYKEKRNGLIDYVFTRWLANPVHHALYVGCSFQDEAMNQLLRDAAGTLPGRYHYALLKWPGATPYAQSSVEELAIKSSSWEAMGVRPVWFDSFEEVPQLIARLA